ncbi:hypothetical protein HMPREF0663_12000 [Hoylesella oralis ATCC 33269]|jgi:hypothetical protein|uniref:Uncharacterized protein n=1 Tax=Hoylesella oralis ATCC 33269 TaxID=873533 RepID=E7RTC7_9BACT|nr:hypothetical protein HMPREF0663_12000 [Hoylesella oralis ATCC 33269]
MHDMVNFHSPTVDEDFRREELIRLIERKVETLTVQELEALYYGMLTRENINDI